MKVYMGPYTTWIGPYQIAEKILFWKDKYVIYDGVSYEDHPDRIAIEKLAVFLDKIPGLTKFCHWINDKKKRKINIHIDNYDVWCADHTLAVIIVPMLKKLKEQKQGSPHVDNKDVPKHLRSTAAKRLTKEEKNTGHTDELWGQRWEWVLDEMIWAFEQHAADDWDSQFYSGEADTMLVKDAEGHTILTTGPNHTFKVDFEAREAAYKRMANGRQLFAKYYQNLWS
jgi:hypothetical protein